MRELILGLLNLMPGPLPVQIIELILCALLALVLALSLVVNSITAVTSMSLSIKSRLNQKRNT